MTKYDGPTQKQQVTTNERGNYQATSMLKSASVRVISETQVAAQQPG